MMNKDFNSPNFHLENDNRSEDVFNLNDSPLPKSSQIQNFDSISPFSSPEETEFKEDGFTPIGFSIRLDIGTDFNMRITSNETDSFTQFTSLSSEAPSLNSLRIADYPLNITQRTMLSIPPKSNESSQKANESQRNRMAQQPTTPQLSHGSYGWARIPYNKRRTPPKFKTSINKEFKKKRATPTPIRRLKSIRTYEDSPPPITISKHRRPHGIFSPRSVYKRQLLGKRDLFGDGYDSPESPWGTGKYHDFDEYDFSGGYCPEKIMDDSLPWDTSDELDGVDEYDLPEQEKSLPTSDLLDLSAIQSRYNLPPQSGQGTPSKTSAYSSQMARGYTPVTSTLRSSSSMGNSPEELDWSGLFSPESTDSPFNDQSQRIFEPSQRRSVSHSGGAMRYFQPSKEFIPRTL